MLTTRIWFLETYEKQHAFYNIPDNIGNTQFMLCAPHDWILEAWTAVFAEPYIKSRTWRKKHRGYGMRTEVSARNPYAKVISYIHGDATIISDCPVSTRRGIHINRARPSWVMR